MDEHRRRLHWAVAWCCLLCAACVSERAGERPAERGDDDAALQFLAALPALPPTALRVDGSFRIRAGPGPDLLLVLRSDADGMRFEVLNELGLEVLMWPPRPDARAAMRARAAGVARMIQLAMGELRQWETVLQSTPWQLTATDNGARILQSGGVAHVRLTSMGTAQQLLVCGQGIRSVEAAARATNEFADQTCITGVPSRMTIEPLGATASPVVEESP